MSNAKETFRGAIKGTLYWANLTTPSKKSGKFQYDLGNLSGTAVKVLNEAGANVRFDDSGMKGYFITPKSIHPIPYVNADNEDLTGVTVGNGSQATALVKVVPYTNNFGKQVAVNTMKLVITDLIVYEPTATADTSALLDNAI